MQQLRKQRLEDVLFFDIEAVPGVGNHEELQPNLQQLWAMKHRLIKKVEDQTSEEG
jgi:hypothetical protein